MATHSSILAQSIPRTQDPGGLPSMGSQRIRRDWAHSHIYTHTGSLHFSPVLLPGHLIFSDYRTGCLVHSREVAADSCRKSCVCFFFCCCSREHQRLKLELLSQESGSTSARIMCSPLERLVDWALGSGGEILLGWGGGQGVILLLSCKQLEKRKEITRNWKCWV